MSQISHVAAIVFALGLGAVASEARAERPTVVVRFYDVTGASAAVRDTALRTAADIAAHAGVIIQWQDCSRSGAAYPCTSVRAPGELMVRLIPEPDVPSGRAADALSVHDAGGAGDLQLGFAAVAPATGAGVLATIYYDRVQRVAARSGVDAGRLLGRAIAHEFGHLLLRAPHSPSGLMRAVWMDTGVSDDRPADWLFSPRDRRLLEAAAVAR